MRNIGYEISQTTNKLHLEISVHIWAIINDQPSNWGNDLADNFLSNIHSNIYKTFL